MKQMMKIIAASIFVIVVLAVLGQVFDIREGEMIPRIMIAVIAIIAVGLIQKSRAKKQKHYQEFYEKQESIPIGFIHTPIRFQAQFMMLMILAIVVVGLIAVAGFLCYQEGALKGEALFYMKMAIVLDLVFIVFLGIVLRKMKQEIGFHEDYVVLHKGKQEKKYYWQEFSFIEKHGKWVSFYGKNGDKLFKTNETNEGYKEFWMVYQKHVTGINKE